MSARGAVLGVILVLAALVIGLVIKVHPHLLRTEYAVNHALRGAVQPQSFFGPLSVGINYVFSPVGTIIILLLLGLLLGTCRQDWTAALRFIVYAGLGSLAAVILKPLFHEPRPQANGLSLGPWLVSEPGHNSFPSGHSAAITAIVMALGLLLATHLARSVAGVVGALAILIVTGSRIYLGVHYLTDVVGGALVAAGAVLIVAWLWDTYVVNIFGLSKGTS